jgi:hypothetical protein
MRVPAPILAAVVLLLVSSSSARAVTVSWTNPGGGSWTTPSNWDIGVPGPTDDAVIALAGTYTVTLPSAASVNSLVPNHGRPDPEPSGALGGHRPVVTTSGFPLSRPAVRRFGRLTSMNHRVRGNAGDHDSSPRARRPHAIEGQGEYTQGILTVASGFTNVGTIALSRVPGVGNPGGTLGVTSGTLVNAPGAFIQALAGSGFILAELDNQGTVSVSTSTEIDKASAHHTSSGQITVSATLG